MPIQLHDPSAIGGRPFGVQRLNPQGSPFLPLSPTELAALSTSDLNRFIFKEIFDTGSDANFDSLKLNLMNKTAIEVPDDVFSWDEQPDQRTALIVDNGAAAAGTVLTAAQAGAAGGFVTATVPFSSGTMQYAGRNVVVAFSPTEHGVITAILSPTTVTVTSLTGEGLPAIVQGAALAVLGESVGDSQVGWVNAERPSKLQRSNYIASFRRALSYGRKELLKLENNSRNNNLEMDRKSIYRELKYDALTNMWIGRKAMRVLYDGNYAKGMDGIHTQMVQGGSTFANTTVNNLAATFETFAMNTNFQSRGGVRNVYARTEWLSILSKEYKDLHTRYKPTDKQADLDLESVRVGGQIYNFVPVEAFGDSNYFPGMANHMYVIDDTSIEPVSQRGLPMWDMGGMMMSHRAARRDVSMAVQDATIRRDSSTRDAELNFSMRMINPRQNFCLIAQ